MKGNSEGPYLVTSYRELIEIIKKRGLKMEVTNYYISKQSGIPLTTVDRIMAGDMEVKLTSILKVCKVLGIEIIVNFKE